MRPSGFPSGHFRIGTNARGSTLSPFVSGHYVLLFSMTVGVIWGIFECTMDQLFFLDMQKDTVVSAIGSIMLDPTGG